MTHPQLAIHKLECPSSDLLVTSDIDIMNWLPIEKKSDSRPAHFIILFVTVIHAVMFVDIR